jgi:hypothetical protein
MPHEVALTGFDERSPLVSSPRSSPLSASVSMRRAATKMVRQRLYDLPLTDPTENKKSKRRGRWVVID